MAAAKQENKYLVVKRQDLFEYFKAFHPSCSCETGDHCFHLEPLNKEGQRLQKALNKILDGIAKNRKAQGKKENKYIVLNQDEEYADFIWSLILAFEDQKEKIKKLLANPQCECDKLVIEGDTIVKIFGNVHLPTCPIAKAYLRYVGECKK